MKIDHQKILIYDGSKGAVLQIQGLENGESADAWNLTHPNTVSSLYRAYAAAGADILQTNTFCANRVQLSGHGLANRLYDINYAGVALAKEAAAGLLVAASIGPTGLITQPAGTLSFDEAYEIFREQIQPLADAGADILHFETFSDLCELRAALAAAQEFTLPVFATVTVENQRTLYGNPAEVCALVCERLGATLTGINCSGGAESILGAIEAMHLAVSIPLLAKPNAGLPVLEAGKLTYTQTPDAFAAYAQSFVQNGVRLVGGCCGSTPEFIRALREAVDTLSPAPEFGPRGTFLASPYAFYDLTGLHAKTPVARITVCAAPYDVVEAACEAEADVLLLDFSACEPDFDMAEFVANFSLSVRAPVVITGGEATPIHAFLRRYTGCAGVCPGVVETLKQAGLPDYGAQAIPSAILEG